MSGERTHTVRLKLRDELWERLCTKAAQLGIDADEVALSLLERAIRRLQTTPRHAA